MATPKSRPPQITVAGPHQCSQSGVGPSLALQKRYEQFAHLFGLLLLDPMPGSVEKVEADHLCAGALLHLVHSPRRLVDAPVALAGDIHRWDVDGASRECVHFG